MSRKRLIFAAMTLSLAAIALITAYGSSNASISRSDQTTQGTQSSAYTQVQGAKYVVLAWNDLGMHCYDPSYQNLAILPPYNTLWAQVIKMGNPPALVTSGVTVYYSFPQNTYSADSSTKNPLGTDFWGAIPPKTDFWKYCPDLFNATLPKNIGLTGKGLAGKMDIVGDHFEAKGIPLTEYRDMDVRGLNQSNWKPNHFQLALITVVDSQTGQKMASTTPTAPLSTELNCGNCHSDDGDATGRYPIEPTGNVDTNILAIHDYINLNLTNPDAYSPPLMEQRPVLCQNCHGDNALGIQSVAGVKNLSSAMHGHHFSATIMDITPDTNGCYQCHPGPSTQCLRDTMSQNFGLSCVDCHGNIGQVSLNTDPWLNEPSCDNANCHGAAYQLNNPLYRFSTGHGGVYCEGCHGSTHAISPSRERNDDLRFIALQGSPGPLKKCTVCHTTMPDTAFKHSPGVTYANETSPTLPPAMLAVQNASNLDGTSNANPPTVLLVLLAAAVLMVVLVEKRGNAKK